MKIAINGAGIAGTAPAFWLQRAGHEVLLVAEAPQLRSGGYIVDFWGIGYDVAEKMGLVERIRERGYLVNEVRLVDDRGSVPRPSARCSWATTWRPSRRGATARVTSWCT